MIEAKKAGFKIPNEVAIEGGMKRLEQFIDQMGTNLVKNSKDNVCKWNLPMETKVTNIVWYSAIGSRVKMSQL